MGELPLDPKALEKAREAHFQVSCYMDDLSPAAVEAAIRAYLEAAPQPAAGDGWMPIETALKNEAFLGLRIEPGVRPVYWIISGLHLQYNDEVDMLGKGYRWNSRDGMYNVVLTHWRPLPAPPSEGGA